MLCGFLLSWAYVFIPNTVKAYEFAFPPFEAYENATKVGHVDQAHVYYANLVDFPHTYEFSLTGQAEVSVGLIIFEQDQAELNKNMIMVKKNRDGSVTEVMRLNAKETAWDAGRDSLAGEDYVESETTVIALEPGSYFVEVNSADNRGKYGLIFGEVKPTFLHPLREMKRVYQLKSFLGRSVGSVMLAPAYWPLYLLVISALIGLWYRKKQ